MIGQKILHYKILEKLGEGGMGVVYKAEDLKLKRNVALKFLPHHLTANDTEQARFVQEAQAVATLNHPNVCTIYDIQEENGQQFIVMEYVDGKTLREMIFGRGEVTSPLRMGDILSYAIQIGDALQEAHSKGIVHRDIKPDNIMINSKNQIKVMDFGLAKLKGSLKLTKTSSTVGTLPYMAPEQIQGGEVDARSDIFSFGVVLYEMLTGHMPFRGEHEAAMMFSILNEEPESLQNYLPQAPAEWMHIFSRSLEKDPEDRYQSVHDMVIDLRRLKKESSKVSRASIPAMKGTVKEETLVGEAGGTGKRAGSTTSVTIHIPGFGKRRIILSAIILGIVVLVIGFYLYTSKGDNGERLPVAVADFVNQTNEPELDGLSGMLITSMEQSRRLAVVTRSRMFDILKQMGKDNVNRIDETLGKEICGVANVNALVIASIQKLDQLYIIDLKVLDPKKNEYIFTAKEQGEGKANIPGLIDKLSEKMRKGLKEKVTEIQKTKQKVSDLTTTNLEAYQHYFQGEQLINKLQFLDAAKEFQKAVAIDTMFALAYYRLAYSLSWGVNPGAKEAIEKAMHYIDKVPEKEQYFIRGEYAEAKGEALQGLAIYKELVKLYPDEKEAIYLVGDYSYHQQDYPIAITHLEKVISMDPTFERAYEHLSWTYTETQQFEKKLKVTREYVARIPNEESYSLLADAYVNQAKFDSALQIYHRSFELYPDRNTIAGIGQTYLFMNKITEAELEFKKLVQESHSLLDQQMGWENLAWLLMYRGRYQDALRGLDRMIEVATKEPNKSPLGEGHARKAFWLNFLLGDRVKANKEIEKAIEFQQVGDIFFYFALIDAYLEMSEYEKVRSIGKNQLSSIIPKDVIENQINALINKRMNNFGSAIENFEALHPGVATRDEKNLYDLAQCYLAINQPDKAIDKLQKIQGSYDNYWRKYGGDYWSAIYPKSFYLMGEAYEQKNDSKHAFEAYQKLLTIWKDADKDIPEYVNAKVRLAKLKGMTTR